MNEVATLEKSNIEITTPSSTEKFVTIRINRQLFAISATFVRDILLPQKITPVLLAAPEIIGLLNLRGRVVTVIDLRVKMGMEASPNRMNNKSIVAKYRNSLYSFVVDEVVGICDIPESAIEQTLEFSGAWKDYCLGSYKLGQELMMILNIEGLLKG